MELSTEPSKPPARTPVHISATEMEDLTEDGGVMKKIMKPGSGPVVTRHAIVTFHYNAYVKCSWTERIDSTWMRNTPHRCNLEELGVLGLQIAVQSMRRGEECHVKIAAGYGFGAQGCLPRIPPNATLVYEIALVDFTETEDDGGADIDSRLMPTNTLFGICCRKQRNGNRIYAAGNVPAAESCYAAAAKFLESAPVPTDDKNNNKRRRLLVKLYSNRAQCALRMHNPKLAVTISRRALLLDPTNAKALYRYAVGLRMLGEYKEAHHVQRRLLALKPQSAHVKKELLLLEGGLVELERDYEDPYEASDELDLKEAFQRLSIEQAVEPVTRSLIRQALEALTTAEPGTELSFVNIFSREDLAYINMVCWDLRLPCYDVQGGLKARRPLL
ncbi:inactive peptidyl-prolyl cis-trans isomerase FKBP6-like isoform X1 [Dermacentor andersoni]|uniref:inactive peptidyl-prolyl cis-trans isomerase FKBP6-like isoform X1 n=1 Tax=Dermacentor andersoni TaxID=34620 RepID=UPI0024179F28|nr:inactive peptidyl-prolyl cis-trans isomerase FKBP6-like isoform X1 [Dermacentor andersoni]